MGRFDTNVEHIRKLPVNNHSISRRLFQKELAHEKYEPKPDKEIKDLVRKAQSGCLISRNEIIERHLRFIYIVTRKYDNYAKDHLLSYSDFINEACINITRCIELANPDSEFKFLSYLQTYVVGAMETAMQKNPVALYASSDVQKKIPFMGNYLDDIRYSQNGSDEEFLYGEYTRVFETNENLAESNIEHEDFILEVERALQTLTPREADVLRLLFHFSNTTFPMFPHEIGDVFDLTKARVLQIADKAIRRLKHTWRSKPLKAYLGNFEFSETISQKLRFQRIINERKIEAETRLISRLREGHTFLIKIEDREYRIVIQEIVKDEEEIVAEVHGYGLTDTFRFDFNEFIEMYKDGKIKKRS